MTDKDLKSIPGYTNTSDEAVYNGITGREIARGLIFAVACFFGLGRVVSFIDAKWRR